MKAIVIDDNEHSWTGDILSGKKTIETRNSNVFKNLAGERIALISSIGKDVRNIVGYATIQEIITYNNFLEFNRDVELHNVKPGSIHHILVENNRGKKYGLRLIDIKSIPAIPVPKKELSGACGIKQIKHEENNVI